MKGLRWVLWALAGLVLVIVVAAGAGVAWLSSPPGRAWLEATVETAASGPGQGLDIEGLTVSPVGVTAARIAVSDAQGVWLVLERVRLDLAPAALLSRRVRITGVEAARIAVDRAPVAAPAQPEPAPPPEPGPLLPGLPVSLSLDRLAVDSIELGPALAGQAARLRLSAAGRLEAGGREAALTAAIDRIDGPPGRLAADIAFVSAGEVLRVDIRGDEPAGGVIVTTAGIPGAPPFHLEIKGDGSLADWRGTVAALAGDAARLTADIGVKGVAQGHAVTLSATADARPVIEALAGAPAAALAGGRPTLTADILVGGDGSIALRPATVTAAAGTLTLSGTAGPGGSPLALAYTLDVPADSPLHALTPVAWTTARAEGLVSGTPTALTVSLSAAVRDLLSTDPALALLAGPEVRLDTTATIDTATGGIRVPSLTLTTPAATVAAEATATGWGQSAQARVTLTADDLSRLSALAGKPLAGKATLTAEAGVAPGGAVRVGGVTLESPYVRLTDGRAVLADGRLDAAASLRAEDLSVLSSLAGVPLAGGAGVTVTAAGPLDALAVEAKAETRNLVANGRTLGRVTLSATATGLPQAPTGTVQAGAALEGQTLALGGAYALSGDTLRLSDLTLTAGRNRIGGGVTVSLATLLAEGKLEGDLPALDAFSALAGVELGGQASFAVTLAGRNGQQDATVSAKAGGLRVTGPGGPLLAARTLTLDASVRDALGTAAGKADLSLRDGSAAGTPLAAVTAGIDGSLAGAGFKLDVKGGGAEAPSLTLAGTAAQTNTQAGALTRIRLTALTARASGQTVTLTRPATVEVGAQHYAVSGLALSSGGARLTADGGLTGGQMHGGLTIDRFPLALAALVDPSLALDGTLGLTLKLAGTVQAPRADVALRLSGVSAAGMAAAGVSGIDATIDGSWRNNRVTATGTLSTRDAGAGRLTLRAAAPLVLNPDTLAVSVPPRGAVSASAQGTFQLARLNDLLAASGDRVRGTLAVDVTAGGTVENPRLGGAVTISGGRYENRASGAVVTDITARLAGDGKVFTLQDFSARTAGGGTITATGTVRPAPQEPRQLDIRVKAVDARLLAMDIVTARIGADLSLTGTFARALLSGTLRVNRADVQEPNRLPPNVVDLGVEEVGRPRNRKPTPVKAAVKEQNPDAPMILALDVKVDVPGQVFVRGRGLDVELGGDLHVGGTAVAPAVTGRLSVQRGQLDLLGKRFAFSRGNLDFDGGVDPRLDVLAEATANQVTAQVEVTGTASRPTIALTSPQGLPQDEVLARVLFGKPASELGAAEAVQLAQSAAELAGYGGGGVLDTVRRTLGVDRLEFSQGTDGKPGGVEAGSYISRDVYVGVEQGLGADQSRVKVEIDLTDTVKAEAKAGGNEGASVGVKFEWDY